MREWTNQTTAAGPLVKSTCCILIHSIDGVSWQNIHTRTMHNLPAGLHYVTGSGPHFSHTHPLPSSLLCWYEMILFGGICHNSWQPRPTVFIQCTLGARWDPITFNGRFLREPHTSELCHECVDIVIMYCHFYLFSLSQQTSASGHNIHTSISRSNWRTFLLFQNKNKNCGQRLSVTDRGRRGWTCCPWSFITQQC